MIWRMTERSRDVELPSGLYKRLYFLRFSLVFNGIMFLVVGDISIDSKMSIINLSIEIYPRSLSKMLISDFFSLLIWKYLWCILTFVYMVGVACKTKLLTGDPSRPYQSRQSRFTKF